MQANPEVMRHMVMGRTSTAAEVWRTMLMSLGSWALRGFWGQGFATEAATAARDWLFEHFPLNRAASFIRPDNLAPKRVVERLGATCERTFELRGEAYEYWVDYRPM
jgi:RimJ/RimL family protein N-acetyltransferase